MLKQRPKVARARMFHRWITGTTLIKLMAARRIEEREASHQGDLRNKKKSQQQ